MSKKNANYYVDPDEFLEAMLNYEEERNTYENPADCEPEPLILRNIILIAENHVKASNFIKVGVDVDELVGEAIHDCYKRGLLRYDSSLGKKPFAYFSQICFYAYLRVLIKEQKEYKKRCKFIQSDPYEYIAIISEIDSIGESVPEEIKATVKKLQGYMDFDLNVEKNDESKHRTRAPLYLQNRTQEEKDLVKAKNAPVIKKEPETILEALTE